jgi:rod shape-determining protein MreB
VLLGAMSFFSNDLAIDLGTANTCVFARGQGIVLNEPSIVAVNNVNDQIEAVGSEAKEMLGRTPGSITAIRPMRDGVIADFDAPRRCSAISSRRRTSGRASSGRASSSACRRRSRRWSAAPSRKAPIAPRPAKCTSSRRAWRPAIGAGLPITEASGSMIVDIGGGTTDIAVISLAGIVYSRSVRIAGNAMDEAIINYVKKEHDL